MSYSDTFLSETIEVARNINTDDVEKNGEVLGRCP